MEYDPERARLPDGRDGAASAPAAPEGHAARKAASVCSTRCRDILRVEDRARAFAVMNEDPCGDRTHDQSLSSVTRPFVPTSGQPSYFHPFFSVMLLYMLSLTFCLLTCLYVCSVVQLFSCSVVLLSLSLSLLAISWRTSCSVFMKPSTSHFQSVEQDIR